MCGIGDPSNAFQISVVGIIKYRLILKQERVEWFNGSILNLCIFYLSTEGTLGQKRTKLGFSKEVEILKRKLPNNCVGNFSERLYSIGE